ncbi:hypothetical protein [Ochrobactrum soli]|nr:hypothetical protein [[Ochrobactrum] soli]
MKPVRISLETFAGDLETYLNGTEENELVLTKDGKPAYVLIGHARAAAWFEAVLDMVTTEAIEAEDDNGEGREAQGNDEPETNATSNNGNDDGVNG